MLRPLLILCLLVPLAPGCEVMKETRPVGPPSAVIPRATPTLAWFVHDPDGNRIGSVVRFETHEQSGRFLYSVRNLHQQDLGVIDDHGRAYRYFPHAEAPAWLSTGPVARGVAGILEVEGEVELTEVSLDALGAALEAPRPLGPGR